MKKWLSKFWNQPNKRFRNFQVVYTFLTLNFLIPSIFYYVAPEKAIAQFRWMGKVLGAEYPLTEESLVWSTLAATNVLTLAFMCFLQQLNVYRFRMVLVPLVFMKGTTALAFLHIYIWVLGFPPFLGVFFIDSISALAMIIFAISARRSLDDHPSDQLVPRLFFDGKEG